MTEQDGDNEKTQIFLSGGAGGPARGARDDKVHEVLLKPARKGVKAPGQVDFDITGEGEVPPAKRQLDFDLTGEGETAAVAGGVDLDLSGGSADAAGVDFDITGGAAEAQGAAEPVPAEPPAGERAAADEPPASKPAPRPATAAPAPTPAPTPASGSRGSLVAIVMLVIVALIGWFLFR